MWEAIRANKRRSFMLISLMGTVLMLLGFVVGMLVGQGNPEAGLVGVGVAFVIWLFLFVLARSAGKSILLGSTGAKEVTHTVAPQLCNVVEEMSIAAGLPKVPHVYIMDTDAPNAFAVGTPENSAVAVTSGLMMRLNRDELQGVIAHEIGHIKNNDSRFMTQAGVMLAAIVILSDVMLRSMIYGGAGRRRSSRSQGGGQAQIIMVVVAIVFAIASPILAQLLYFACSRKREYLADASAARFTRYPEGLASALEKIAGSAGSGPKPKFGRAVLPMLIINPLSAAGAAGLTSTHPPTKDRVNILRSMGGGAGFSAYEQAYKQAHGGEACMGASTLTSTERTAARDACPDSEAGDLKRARDAVDILHRTAGLLVLNCACGLKIKLPPGYDKTEVACPRCGVENVIPTAVMASALAAMNELDESGDLDILGDSEPSEVPEELVFRYTPGRWNNFRCACSNTMQLSPSFAASATSCPKCGRRIRIERAA